jgi:asparagine synthase (glutamine-hydrolysing)
MLERLRHRGPDARGRKDFGAATLLHTRLSIIDLSATGEQPLCNEDGSIWVVFNGEIYNHRDLRQQLEQRGHQFRGKSDGEVLPHLYEEMGLDLLPRLKGMFSFSIWDERKGHLLLARDRFGIKPLFFAQGKDSLAFASEIPALLDLPGLDLGVDRQAVFDFAALTFIPAPQTFYRGIRSLCPGEVMVVDRRSIAAARPTSFMRWSIVPDSSLSLEQATARAGELLQQAVTRQLEAEVPLGSLLSGGIDSSLASAVAAGALADGLHTFNVKFDDADYDETDAAVEVAHRIGSRHQTLSMPSDAGTWENVTSLLQHVGQPFADTSIFAVNAVCRRMREFVTVALSGDGGDEGYGGYQTYADLPRNNLVRAVPYPFRQIAARLSLRFRRNAFARRMGARLSELGPGDDTDLIALMLSWVRRPEHRALCRFDGLPIRRHFERQWDHQLPRGSSAVERLSAHLTEVSIRLVQANDLLPKVDMASMRESLEVRVPMLDEDLFAFGLTLPHRLKVMGGTPKVVLRAIAERRLGNRIARKKKQGFGVPVDTWVDDAFRARLRDELLASTTRLDEHFEPTVYRPYLEAFAAGRPHDTVSRQGLYQRVIMLLSAHLALRPRAAHPS